LEWDDHLARLPAAERLKRNVGSNDAKITLTPGTQPACGVCRHGRIGHQASGIREVAELPGSRRRTERPCGIAQGKRDVAQCLPGAPDDVRAQKVRQSHVDLAGVVVNAALADSAPSEPVPLAVKVIAVAWAVDSPKAIVSANAPAETNLTSLIPRS